MIFHDWKLFTKAPVVRPDTIEIFSKEEWDAFVLYAPQLDPLQIVRLRINLDLQGETYDPIVYAGSFDGDNHTISNATFSAVDDKRGMFASIGPGQVFANLRLNNINASDASETYPAVTYAGALAATVEGTAANPATIWNVRVSDSTVIGINSGGLVGSADCVLIKYCGIENVSVGMSFEYGYEWWSGGIAGVLYSGSIEDSYANTDAIYSLQTICRGGIVGLMAESTNGSGTIAGVWCTYEQAYGKLNAGTASDRVVSDAAKYDQWDWIDFVSSATCWDYDLSVGGYPSLIEDVCYYQFTY